MAEVSDWIASDITVGDYERLTVPSHPEAVAVMAYWEQHAAQGLRIGRDIPSHAVAHWLSHMSVNEPIPGGCDFKIRLAGEAVKVRFGRDVTGERLTRLFGAAEFLPRSADLCDVIAHGCPHLARVHYHAGNVDILNVELVMLPVTAPNGVDHWALTFAFYC